MIDKDLTKKEAGIAINEQAIPTETMKSTGTYTSERMAEAPEEGFREVLGIRIIENGVGYAVGEMDIQPTHLNPLGVVHGGCMFSIADTVSGVSALGRGGRVTTVSGNISYLRAGKDTTKIVAKARETKYGRTFSVCEAQLFDDKDNLLAITTMTFFHLND